MSGHLCKLDDSSTRAYCTASRSGWGLFGVVVFSCLSFLFFLPVSGNGLRWIEILSQKAFYPTALRMVKSHRVFAVLSAIGLNSKQ